MNPLPPWSGLFAVATLIAYHLVTTRQRVIVLALASYGFYAIVAAQFLPLLAGTTLLAYLAGKRVEETRSPILATAVVIALAAALLVVRAIYRGNPIAEPFVAVGASFYVLQAISYVLDCYNGVRGSRISLAELAVYLAYFPKLLAGPIESAGRFAAQLRAPAPVDDAALADAASLITLGTLRKIALADPLRATLPSQIFAQPQEASPTVLTLSLVVFFFSLYNDFAAYTDIARGVSRLFGIELSTNFRQPVFASGISDFWNRWHTSLTHWLRDYVYLPASRAILRRGFALRHPVNLLAPPTLTMLTSGAWHGATAMLGLWGLLHGLLLAAERAFALRPGRAPSVLARALSLMALWGIGLPTLVLFLTPDFDTAVRYWSAILAVGATVTDSPNTGTVLTGAVTALLIAASLALDLAQRRYGELFFLSWPRLLRALSLAAVAVVCFLLSLRQPITAFVYQGF